MEVTEQDRTNAQTAGQLKALILAVSLALDECTRVQLRALDAATADTFSATSLVSEEERSIYAEGFNGVLRIIERSASA